MAALLRKSGGTFQLVDRRCEYCTGVGWTQVWDGHKSVDSRFEILSGMLELFMNLGAQMLTADFAE